MIVLLKQSEYASDVLLGSNVRDTNETLTIQLDVMFGVDILRPLISPRGLREMAAYTP